jgi:hypothetical protein
MAVTEGIVLNLQGNIFMSFSCIKIFTPCENHSRDGWFTDMLPKKLFCRVESGNGLTGNAYRLKKSRSGLPGPDFINGLRIFRQSLHILAPVHRMADLANKVFFTSALSPA